MEDNRKEQIEALEVLLEFNERLVKNMNIIVKELSGKRLDDTDKFLKSIVDAINWEIQVVNGTLEVINDGEERLDKKHLTRQFPHWQRQSRQRMMRQWQRSSRM